MAGNNNNAEGTWVCSCGKANTGKFCVKCGAPRPAVPVPQPASPVEWVCTCGRTNTGKFCVKCGNPRPAAGPEEASGPKSLPQGVRPQGASRSANGTVVMPLGGNNPAVDTVAMLSRNHKLAEEETARKAAEEAVRKAAEEAAVRQAREASPVSSAEADGNKGMMKKAAIGALVLLLLIGVYFMFGKKKEVPPSTESQKIETKTKTKEETKTEKEKPMDPAVKAEKLKGYAEAMTKANEQKKQDATANQKIVFLIDEVQRKNNDLVISGHFYNGKKNRTIISVKAMELDIVLRDVDKELLNEKNIKYEKAFTGMNIKPLHDSEKLTVNLPGKAPAAEFNNFMVTAHDVHWEGVGD